MRGPAKSPPKYRKHKATGQALVTIGGKDFYLGPHNSKASQLEYDRHISEWLANGRRLPGAADQGLSVTQLIAAYWRFAQTWYVRTDLGEEDIESLLRGLLQADDGLIIQSVDDEARLAGTRMRWFRQRPLLQDGVATNIVAFPVVTVPRHGTTQVGIRLGILRLVALRLGLGLRLGRRGGRRRRRRRRLLLLGRRRRGRHVAGAAAARGALGAGGGSLQARHEHQGKQGEERASQRQQLESRRRAHVTSDFARSANPAVSIMALPARGRNRTPCPSSCVPLKHTRLARGTAFGAPSHRARGRAHPHGCAAGG